MKRVASLCAAVLLCLIPAQAQQAVMRNGRPALKLSTPDEVWFVEDAGGIEPTFRFLVNDARRLGVGWLHVSAVNVSFDASPGYNLSERQRFKVQRSELGPIELSKHGYVDIRVAGMVRSFVPVNPHTGQGFFSKEMCDWIVGSLMDFAATYEEFKRLTASLQPNPPPQASPAPVPAEAVKPPRPPMLVLSVQPANVQVYVDDIFKGMTSSEGRLVVEGLSPRAHRVRMNLIGYTESARTVELKAGETATIEAKLEPAGPKPLALAEIEEGLTNGLPPKGITKLVNQYGVDFTLTKPIEQRLREKGADSDLLVAIATNKK